MSVKVQQFVFKAFANENHAKFFSWQMATLYALIGEDDEGLAIEKLGTLLKKENWVRITPFNKSTISER